MPLLYVLDAKKARRNGLAKDKSRRRKTDEPMPESVFLI
jgi:hypothetical protein